MLSLEVVVIIIVVVAVLPTLYDVVLTLAVITVAPLLSLSVRPPSSTQLLATARVSPASGNNNNNFAGRFLMLSVSRLTKLQEDIFLLFGSPENIYDKMASLFCFQPQYANLEERIACQPCTCTMH